MLLRKLLVQWGRHRGAQLLHLAHTDAVYYTSSTTAIAATTVIAATSITTAIAATFTAAAIAATSITTALAPTSITTALAASHEPLPRRRLPHAGGHQPALRHVLRRKRPNLVDVPGRHVGRRAVHHAGRGAPALRERRDLHGLRLVREHRDE